MERVMGQIIFTAALFLGYGTAGGWPTWTLVALLAVAVVATWMIGGEG